MSELRPFSKEWQIEEACGEGLNQSLTELRGQIKGMQLYRVEVEQILARRSIPELEELHQRMAKQELEAIEALGHVLEAFEAHYKRMYGEDPSIHDLSSNF